VNAYQTCRDGDCNPYSCPVCANTCPVCGQWGLPCECPTLPLDDEEEA
jgi:hypothetical protein